MSVRNHFDTLRSHIQQQILGQAVLVDRLLIALLADGHLLVEGAPGLAKTKAIKALAEGIEADFQRLQFTPDLLPSDLLGTDIYRPESGEFVFQSGPIFHNLLLADEINRAPAKVQSALLEAMAERQVSIAGATRALPELFLVMATQNPIEQEGTYPLPEAQLDRFLLHVRIDYPALETEREILQLARREEQHVLAAPTEKLTQAAILEARTEVRAVHMAPALDEYLVQLIHATRDASAYNIEGIAYGASPRATIALDRCARAHAWLQGNDFVTPEDIQAIAPDVLRHRILLNYEAEAEGMTSDRIIEQLLLTVPVP